MIINSPSTLAIEYFSLLSFQTQLLTIKRSTSTQIRELLSNPNLPTPPPPQKKEKKNQWHKQKYSIEANAINCLLTFQILKAKLQYGDHKITRRCGLQHAKQVIIESIPRTSKQVIMELRSKESKP